MSSTELVTKRLHVSGLTPQISAVDLKSRFASFGNVKALDGLGKLDAIGQHKPYAYVTLESTKSQLAKCLNLLSGTTWKGAKLRIGEAKPDFRERIRKENETVNVADARPAKRRRLTRGAQGVHASDMSLVTATSLRPGWRITPLGRLVRPMRMRPLRPLPSPASTDAADAPERKALKERKRKAKKNTMLVRTRRRRINPEDWGSSYLSGMMLENGSGTVLPEKIAKISEPHRNESTADTDEISRHAAPRPEKRRSQSQSPPPPTLSASLADSSSPTVNETPPVVAQPDPDIAEEAARSLALLSALFNTKGHQGPERNIDDEDWGGAESLSDLDVDVEPPTTTAVNPEGIDDEVEYVPRTVPDASVTTEKGPEEHLSAPEVVMVPIIEKELAKEVPQMPLQANAQTTKLKNMFAPRPEDVGFSILGDLDLDLELDDEYSNITTPLPALHPSNIDALSFAPAPSAFNLASQQSALAFDPDRPFFFPHSLSQHSSLSIKPGDPRDLFSGVSDFYRTESSEEIRARWEARKLELTRDWKRRHREAVKSARRRGGARD